MPRLRLDDEEFIYSLTFPEDHREIGNKLNEFWNVINGKVPISYDLLDKFTKMFFESGSGVYVGIESCLPSRFLDLYPRWLDYHEQYLGRLSPDQAKQGGRILIARSVGEIYNDKRNPNFYKFVNWHKTKKVPLYHVSSERITQLSSKYELNSPDVALWMDSFAVIVKHEKSQSETPLMRIFVITKDQPEFAKVLNYVEEVKDIIKELDPDRLGIISPELAEAWKGYTGSLEERKHIHEFLEKLLRKFKHGRGVIFDAAAGIGNEALYLLKKGYLVEVNEADPTFAYQLLKNISSDEDLKQKGITEEQINTRIHKRDWRDLTKEIFPESMSAVLVLGNSLSMVISDGYEERYKCIKQFCEILSPGGILIIDERNYPKIREELKKGLDVEGKSVMYPAPEINCKLTVGDNDKIIFFNFFDKYRKKIGEPIPTSYLEKDELKKILEDVFKTKDTIFSDLKLINPPNPNALFYTHCIVKSGKKSPSKPKPKQIKKQLKAFAKATSDIFIGSKEETAQWGVIGKSDRRLVKFDLNKAHTVFVCGGPGSGKGYTIGVLCEMLVSGSIPGISKVSEDKRATIIVLHKSTGEDERSDFWSITKENDNPEECRKLENEYGVKPYSLVSKDNVRIFIDPSIKREESISEFKKEYETDDVFPFKVDPSTITGDAWNDILSTVGSLGIFAPQIAKEVYYNIKKVKNASGIVSINAIKKQIQDHKLLSQEQKEAAISTLDLLKPYLTDGEQDFVSKLKLGGVNIFDFREKKELTLHEQDIFSIITLILRVIQTSEKLKDKPIVLVMNEAHEYFKKDMPQEFVNVIENLLRMYRHGYKWFILDTQLTNDVHPIVVALADVKIVHSLTSVENKDLKDALGEIADKPILPKQKGKAYIVANESSEKGPILVNIRPRLTKHGGFSKTLIKQFESQKT